MRSLELAVDALNLVGCRTAQFSWVQSRSLQLAAVPLTLVGVQSVRSSFGLTILQVANSQKGTDLQDLSRLAEPCKSLIPKREPTCRT